jgi:hypothetical protein
MWLAAVARVPLFKVALGGLLARGGSADDAIAVAREATRKAVVHGAGVGLSEATMEAILRQTARHLDQHRYSHLSA